MFEKLSLLWKGDAPLKKEYRDFVQMLTLAREMFHRITELLKKGGDVKEIESEVYQKDIQINKLERRIRKALVTHLSINPGQAVPASLVLMSIVKDAERLGDFCKNLYEAAEYWCRPRSEMVYSDRISEFQKYVNDLFDNAINAFEAEDDVLAAEIIQDEVLWNKRFDSFIGELAASEISTREAVSSVLMVRSLKRLQAHLANIASSVVLPVHHIDHRPKHLRDA